MAAHVVYRGQDRNTFRPSFLAAAMVVARVNVLCNAISFALHVKAHFSSSLPSLLVTGRQYKAKMN